MKRRHLLASGSASGTVALSIPFISHELANSHAWTVGSTAAMPGPLGGFGLENQKAVAGIRNFDFGGLQIDYSGTAARVGSADVNPGILSGNGRIMS